MVILFLVGRESVVSLVVCGGLVCDWDASLGWSLVYF